MSTWKRFVSLILLFCASTAAACSDGVSPEDPGEVTVTDGGASSVLCSGPAGTPYLENPWGNLDCNTVLRIKPVGTGWQQNERDEVEQAVNIVGGVLDGSHDLPTVVYSEGTSNPAIEVSITGTGSLYWGEFHRATPGTITIHRSTQAFPAPGVPGRTVDLGDMHGVVLHEILDLFGFKERNTSLLEDAGCAIEVPELPDPFPTSMCLYEEQSLFASFGLREDDVDLSQSMLTGLNLSPSSLSLEPTDIANITATICESGSTCGGVSLVMGTEFESVEGTANSVEGPASSVEGTANVVIPQVISWDEPSNPAVVSLTDRTEAGAKVTALSEGNATISASLSPGPRVVWPEPPPAVVDVAVSEPCTVAFSPSSADIEIGEIEIFTATQFCSGITASLTPTNGSVGFSQGTACTLTSVSAQGLVKVRGCQEGPATLTIRQDGVVVQTINIDVVPPPPPVVASVSTSPGSVILNAANPERLVTATAYDQHGAPMSGVSFNWAKSSPWILLSGTGNTRTVSGCNNPPLPFYGSLTVTAAGTNVSKTISVRIHASYPHACIF